MPGCTEPEMLAYVLLRRHGCQPPRGPGGYRTARGPEPYIAVTGSQRVAGTRCSFGTGTIFALEPGQHPGIIRVGTDGRASRFASVPATGPHRLRPLARSGTRGQTHAARTSSGEYEKNNRIIYIKIASAFNALARGGSASAGGQRLPEQARTLR